MHVVLEEDSGPASPGFTPAETAIREFCINNHGLIVVPELPGALRKQLHPMGEMIWYADPLLGDRLVSIDSHRMYSIYDTKVHSRTGTLLIWVTPETAGRIVIEWRQQTGCGSSRNAVRCRHEESGTIRFSITENRLVICDQPLRCERDSTQLSIGLSWTNCDRHEVYPKRPDMDAHYVAIRTLDRERTIKRLRHVLPELSPSLHSLRALPDLSDVCRAIINASPYARVLYVTNEHDSPWKVMVIDTVSLLSSFGGELVKVERVGLLDRKATHVICTCPWDPSWRIRAGRNQVLQVYYVGYRQQAPFRAAAEAGLLETPDTLTVIPGVCSPTPVQLVARVIRSMPRYSGICWENAAEALLLRYDVIVDRGECKDWDLDAVEAVVQKVWKGKYCGMSIKWEVKPGKWGLLVDGKLVENQWSCYVNIGGFPINMTKLWCSINPMNRRYLD